MKLVHEVLEEARKKRAKADKIKVLKDNESWALKDILLGSTDTTIPITLPDLTLYSNMNIIWAIR